MVHQKVEDTRAHTDRSIPLKNDSQGMEEATMIFVLLPCSLGARLFKLHDQPASKLRKPPAGRIDRHFKGLASRAGTPQCLAPCRPWAMVAAVALQRMAQDGVGLIGNSKVEVAILLPFGSHAGSSSCTEDLIT